MTGEETKIEIKKIIDQLPEEVLQDVLTFLKYLKNAPGANIRTISHIKQIITEDSELLRRLAE